MGVAARDDQRKKRIGSRKRRFSFHQHGMDVAFEMIHCNQRALRCKRDCLGEGDADQQRAGQARTFGDGDRIKLLVVDARAVHRLTDNRHDGAKMFPAGEFRHDAAVVRVHEL